MADPYNNTGKLCKTCGQSMPVMREPKREYDANKQLAATKPLKGLVKAQKR